MAKMLNVDPWRRYPLTVQVLSSDFSPLLTGVQADDGKHFDVKSSPR
jgi:hypothetical protein